ncbi:pre-rRNA-processing protein esf1 [Mycoblastus sanguinarius]|nr:pre-rRNA-processing protein esf1 [Mycoblastus sanguinarius]
MLRDENFSSKAKVDRYGRKLPKDAGRKELERYYRIDDEDEQRKGDEEVEQELERMKGEKELVPSSSDDSSSDEEDDEEDDEDEVFGLLEEQADGGDSIPKGQVSSRIAIVNLDWDNIRAADLMAVFSSFVPTSGRIRKISVYPSEFGKERMEREEMEGPPKEIFDQNKADVLQEARFSSGEEEEEAEGEEEEGDEGEDERIKRSILKEDRGEEFNSAKLRRYQLERLRYYYAVLECSSASTAQTIYDAVDGTEYLTTANFFDCRYIPDDTDFADDKPRDECDRIPDGYKPNEFVTDALQHSKVRLTWDADDGTRKEAQKRAFAGSRAGIDENDLKAYLGSDSSEDEGPEPVVVDATSEAPLDITKGKADSNEPRPKLSKKDAERQKMRALLGLQQEPATTKKSKAEKSAPIGDMQITFSSGLSSEPKGSVFENEPERDETTVEKYVRKEKERKSRRKEKLKDKCTTTDPATDQAETKEKPGDASTADDKSPQDLGFSDPFFTTPSNDKTTTSSQRKAEKRAKREQRVAEEAAAETKRAELELLMVDDKTSTKDINHFDINEIAKAEKALSKKKKSKKRLSEREKEALAMKEKDQFKINTGDERFKDVFERSEFAIDPSHPRFKGTEGMKELLEEGRRKRKGGIGGEDEEEKRVERKKERKEDDVEGLVKRLKGKMKTSR